MAHHTARDRHAPQREPIALKATQYSVLSTSLMAGFGGTAAERSIEALSAGAALDCVGVDDGEAAAHQAVDEVDLRAAQVLQRKRIDDYLDARLLDDFVVVSRF